jgi:hypothetical protein
MSGEQFDRTDAERFIRHTLGISRGFFVIARARHEHGSKTPVPGSWRDTYYPYPQGVARAVRDAFDWDAQGFDVYVSAHAVTEQGSRKKANAAPVRALFSDLDDGRPPDNLPASAVLETSPGRLQGVWQLREATAPQAAEALNKRLAAACGADPSGADISQVLRLPGTHNWTRPGAPLVRLLDLHGSVAYSREQLDQALPAGTDRQSTAEPKAAGAPVPSGKRHSYIMGVLAAAQRFGVSGEGLARIADVLNECELEESLPADELASIAEHVAQFAPDEQLRGLHEAERCAHCEEKDAWAAKQQARAEAAEAKAQERLQFLGDIAELVADPTVGEEVRLWVGLAIAHYRNDPALEPMTGNRWRLTQKLARRLCGKKNLKTAGAYTVKLAERGALPLGEEERRRFTKADGHKVEADTLTYQWPPAPADQAAETVQANQPTLACRARRLAAARAERERRGNLRNFEPCPDHPHAGAKLRPHCAICDRRLQPRDETVHATAPAPHPTREPLQPLEPKSKRSIQTAEQPRCRICSSILAAAGARCSRCAQPPAELLADLAAIPEHPPEPLQPLEQRPRILRGAELTAFLRQREAAYAAVGGD